MMQSNYMVTNSHTSSNVLNSDKSKLSVDEFETQVDPIEPLLPRSAWDSKVAFLRAICRTKKLLDRIENEAGILRS
jgi:hypothetical protein